MHETNNAPWAEHTAKHEQAPPRPWLITAVEYVAEKQAALDPGAGALQDSKYLLEQDFAHVTAVDFSDVVIPLAEKLPQDRFTFVQSAFEDFTFIPKKYDLLSAQFSLPFTSPLEFSRVFNDIKAALKKNGIFVGQFFGENDSWNKNIGISFM